MDNRGISAQSFVRECVALQEAWECGALVLVGELPPHLQAILGDKLGVNVSTNEDVEVQTPSEQATEVVEVKVDKATDTNVETVEVINQNVVAPDVETNPTKLEPTPLAHSAQIKVVTSDEKSDTENFTSPSSAEEIAIQLRSCQTWSEITAITETLDQATRIQSWAMLDKLEQQRILEIKFREHQTRKVVVKLAYKA